MEIVLRFFTDINEATFATVWGKEVIIPRRGEKILIDYEKYKVKDIHYCYETNGGQCEMPLNSVQMIDVIVKHCDMGDLYETN